MYFYNTETGERTWEKPRESVLAEQEVKERQRRQEQAERREQLEKFPKRLQRWVLCGLSQTARDVVVSDVSVGIDISVRKSPMLVAQD